MATDIISLDPKIIKENNSFVLPYTPVFSVFNMVLHQEGLKEQLFENWSIRLDDFDNTMAKMFKPTDTQRYHAKAVREVFNYYSSVFLLKFIQSDFQNRVPAEFNSEVIKRLTIQFETNVFKGDSKNYGVYTNPNTVNNADADITDINSLSSVFSTLKRDIAKNTYSNQRDVTFIFSGKGLTNFLSKVTSGKLNEDILAPIIGNSYVTAEDFIETKDQIIAFAPNSVNLHYTALPQLYNTGKNEENTYDFRNYALSTNAVEVRQKGALIVQPLNFK